MSSSRHHRFDQDVSARRARARAHLARVRGRHDEARRGVAGTSFRVGRAGLLVAGVGSALGLLFGDSLIFQASGDALALDVIAVRGASRLSPREVAAATGVPVGAPRQAVDAGAVVQSLEAHDWIAKARALRLPGALVVDVREREPVATVVVQEQLYAVDRDGQPFAPIEADSLPGLVRIVADGDDVRPHEPSPRLATAVHLAQRLPELGLAPPREVTIAAEDDPRGYGLRLAALDARVVLGRADLDARLDALARLLAARPDVVEGASTIDLRFADQVVLRSASARDGSADQADGRGDARPRNLRPTG
jgi:cell division protein FtsQ